MADQRQECARATALLTIVSLCWPMAVAFAAATSAPRLPACCMRAAHACRMQHAAHSPANADKVEGVCRACGWCHAVPNGPAYIRATVVTFSFSLQTLPGVARPTAEPHDSATRLHASRAPPRFVFAPEQV